MVVLCGVGRDRGLHWMGGDSFGLQAEVFFSSLWLEAPRPGDHRHNRITLTDDSSKTYISKPILVCGLCLRTGCGAHYGPAAVEPRRQGKGRRADKGRRLAQIPRPSRGWNFDRKRPPEIPAAVRSPGALVPLSGGLFQPSRRIPWTPDHLSPGGDGRGARMPRLHYRGSNLEANLSHFLPGPLRIQQRPKVFAHNRGKQGLRLWRRGQTELPRL